MVVGKVVSNKKFEENFNGCRDCKIVNSSVDIAKTFFKLNVIRNWFGYIYISVHITKQFVNIRIS